MTIPPPDIDASKLRFQPASANNATGIAALVNAAYRGEGSRRGWTTEADLLEGTRTDVDEVRRLIEHEDSVILLCIAEDAPIGSVYLKRLGTRCYLVMLVVRPDLQGAGIGKRLINAAEDFAVSHWKCSMITMTVISVRTELIAFYERRGYRRTGRTAPFVVDQPQGIPKVEGLMFEELEKILPPNAAATTPAALR